MRQRMNLFQMIIPSHISRHSIQIISFIYSETKSRHAIQALACEILAYDFSWVLFFSVFILPMCSEYFAGLRLQLSLPFPLKVLPHTLLRFLTFCLHLCNAALTCHWSLNSRTTTAIEKHKTIPKNYRNWFLIFFCNLNHFDLEIKSNQIKSNLIEQNV